jgi:hypothetical protein
MNETGLKVVEETFGFLGSNPKISALWLLVALCVYCLLYIAYKRLKN